MGPRRRHHEGQLDLVELLQRMGRDIGQDLRAAMTADIIESGLSRDQVGDRMSILLGRGITKAQLDVFTAPGKTGHRFPMEYLPAFVEATGEYRTLEVLVEACGGRVVIPSRVRARLLQVEEERKRLVKKERVLRVLGDGALEEALG